MWLGPEATVHVMRGLGDALEHDVAALSEDTARRSLVPSVDSGVRTCPTCNLVMSRLEVGAVTIDSCATHGTWFDRHEVGHAPRASPSPHRSGHNRPMRVLILGGGGTLGAFSAGALLALEQAVGAFIKRNG